MRRNSCDRFLVLLGLALLGACAPQALAAGESYPTSAAERQQARAELERRRYPIFDGSSFLSAAASGDLEAVRLFLRAGMSVDTKDERDGTTTALINATFMGQHEMAVLLLEAGADVNANNGATPLIHAAGKCAMNDVVQTLIARGAGLDARAPGGATPLGMAKLFNCVENERLLTEAGARADLEAPGAQKPAEKPVAGQATLPPPWSRLKPGAWVLYRSGAPDAPVQSQMKWIVRSITSQRVVYVVESTTVLPGGQTIEGQPMELALDAAHVMGVDGTGVTQSDASLLVHGRTLAVRLHETETETGGQRYLVKTWMSDEVPFGIVRTEVNGELSQEALEWGWGP
jgi:hypothetical protein